MARILKKDRSNGNSMSAGNGHNGGSPSLVAKLFGLGQNGSRPSPDKTFFTTTDGAAVVNYEELVKDEDFKRSAEDVREFLTKNIPSAPQK